MEIKYGVLPVNMPLFPCLPFTTPISGQVISAQVASGRAVSPFLTALTVNKQLIRETL